VEEGNGVWYTIIIEGGGCVASGRHGQTTSVPGLVESIEFMYDAPDGFYHL